MALQYSEEVRNAKLDAVETAIGTSPILYIFDGTLPSDCASADNGTVLATVNLPSDWMAAASSGSKAKAGTWQDSAADATGTASYFRIKDSTGTTCHIQGSVTITGSGGVMTVDNPSFGVGQVFTVTSFTISSGNQ